MAKYAVIGSTVTFNDPPPLDANGLNISCPQSCAQDTFDIGAASSFGAAYMYSKLNSDQTRIFFTANEGSACTNTNYPLRPSLGPRGTNAHCTTHHVHPMPVNLSRFSHMTLPMQSLQTTRSGGGCLRSFCR